MSDALPNNGTGRAHGMLPADVAVHSRLAGDMFTSALNCEDRGRGGPVGSAPTVIPVGTGVPVIRCQLYPKKRHLRQNCINHLNAELNPICHLLALLGGTIFSTLAG